MRVKDMMTPTVVFVGEDATVAQAAAEMKTHDVGCLPILADDMVLGVVSDRDIVIRAAAAGLEPCFTKVHKAMTTGACCCRPDDDVEAAARVMGRKKVRRLLVVDQDDRLVGIVSLGDLAARVPDSRLAGTVLAEVCSAS